MASPKKQSTNPEQPAAPAPKRSTTDNPLVFISHDSRDADLAEAFGNLLTDASGGILKSFRSSDRKGTAGIEYGQEWYRAIMNKLDDASDVVALLTAHSINRPWILYETGVAKGKLDGASSVLGLALGVSLDEAATGPFAQFQNSPDDEDAITGLVLQLIRRHPQADPREEAVRRQVQAFRSTVSSMLEERKKKPQTAARRDDETSVAKFFEEIKVLVRDVPERVAGELGTDLRARRKKSRRFHPLMLIEDLMHHPAFRESKDQRGVAILIAFSLVRDDLPWLYELGVELFRALARGDHDAVVRIQRTLKQLREMFHTGPMMEMFLGGPVDEETAMTVDHLMHTVARMVPPPPEIPRTKKSRLDSDSKME